MGCGEVITYNGGGATECAPRVSSGACSGCPDGNYVGGFKYISIQHGGTTKYLQYSAATDVTYSPPSTCGKRPMRTHTRARTHAHAYALTHMRPIHTCAHIFATSIYGS